MSIQNSIDSFLRTHILRTVQDIVYIPQDEQVVVLRKMGYRNATIDISGAASPSEAMEMISGHLAVY